MRNAVRVAIVRLRHDVTRKDYAAKDAGSAGWPRRLNGKNGLTGGANDLYRQSEAIAEAFSIFLRPDCELTFAKAS